MRYSQYFIPTLKETPADAEVVSHQLMVRAGMLRKVAAGIYDYLPLGLRSIRKFEEIVREEMNKAGAIELLMPAVLPAEHWKESGRWDVYGKELLRFTDRAEREFCIGPTHEEIITDIVRREVKSYKQLPVNLYQIQTKFRDEIRPRFGVMRAREFIMKDAYSFDAADEGADKSYWAMYEAYSKIFERCGLEFRAVLADTGNIGGSFSHEFMVLAETGEDVVMSCDKCDYAANLELAEIKQTDNRSDASSSESKDIEEVHTPAMKSVEEVAEFLKVKSGDLIKTMIVEADGEPVAALVSGDNELSITKLRRHLGADVIDLATPDVIEKATGGALGFSGPVGLKIKIVADHSIKQIIDGVTGANKKDYHLVNVNLDKDYDVNEFADIRVAADGDGCPNCDGGKLKSTRGIEVGHVFKLGTKYSESMNANFVDEDGKEKPFIMGCYGIGIGRTVAAAIEQNFDDSGMILPRALAPFEVIVMPLNMKDENVIKVANEIYNTLVEKGYDVLIDDRKESAGFKFKDADLIGIPLQVRIGPKTLKENSVEIRLRKNGETMLVKVEDAVSEVIKTVESI
ncbi:MAG: proline--tRNA ligase [Candidatus Dadabacteria bacterium]|nr:proline--tRNA ligase [Candidatus Dadabacteria bacterium]NIS09142.1 proline--tRNA ligase [Candidatus Dadabacteria bacterium]NIY22449.1 proline--tRNA ligase [Candidatus Dadabacteria bacterium]